MKKIPNSKSQCSKFEIGIYDLKFFGYYILYLVSCNFHIAGIAHAATSDDLCALDPTFVNCSSGKNTSDAFNYLIQNLVSRVPYYLGGLALLALMYSGAIYILALGDPTKMESAKKNITWTVTGILAILALYAIIATVAWLASPGF